MKLTAMAHLFSTMTRRALGKMPESTLNWTVQLLERVIEVPGLSLGLALLLADYHIRRNKVARSSHAKTWWAWH